MQLSHNKCEDFDGILTAKLDDRVHAYVNTGHPTLSIGHGTILFADDAQAEEAIRKLSHILTVRRATAEAVAAVDKQVVPPTEDSRPQVGETASDTESIPCPMCGDEYGRAAAADAGGLCEHCADRQVA